MMKRLFWFAIGSLIAMLICFSEVYAVAIPITYIGVSTGLEETGGNKEFKWLYYADTSTPGTWNNGMYRYWDMSLTPVSMSPDTYNDIYVNMDIIYKSKQRNTYFKDMKICYNNKCTDGNITEHIIDETTQKDSQGYYHRHSVIQLRGIYKLREYDASIIYFSVSFNSENTIETITASISDYPTIKTLTNEEAQIEANRQHASAIINAANKDTDKLLNSDINDNEIISKFDLFNSVLEQNGTITNLMVLPITIWTTVYSSVGQQCSPFYLGEMLGTHIYLPCLDIEDYLGFSLWNTIDILFTGFFIYVISKKMILVFDKFSSLQEGDVISD